jgi:hypothetical protein
MIIEWHAHVYPPILEDFPRLTLVSSHGGGGICEVIGRMNYACELQEEAYFLGSCTPMRIKHRPLSPVDVFRVGDLPRAGGPAGDSTRSAWPRALWQRRAAAHLAQATRHPTDRGSRSWPRRKEAIFWRNAARLLKLSESDVRQHA